MLLQASDTSAVVLASDHEAFAILRVCNSEEKKWEIFSNIWWSTWELLKNPDFFKIIVRLLSDSLAAFRHITLGTCQGNHWNCKSAWKI